VGVRFDAQAPSLRLSTPEDRPKEGGGVRGDKKRQEKGSWDKEREGKEWQYRGKEKQKQGRIRGK
jgi:hypothetical protein